MRISHLLLVICVFLSNGPKLVLATPPRPSLLGMRLVAAKETDFFTFFHLVESWREQDAAKRNVVIFKPSSPAFGKLVTVRTTLNSQDEIVQMELDLARSFIDSAEGVFANDIAKNMLASSPPAQDVPPIGGMIGEIARRTPPNTEVVELRPVPKETEIESPGYLTYVGRRKMYNRELSASTLSMENVSQKGEPWLQIKVSLKSKLRVNHRGSAVWNSSRVNAVL